MADPASGPTESVTVAAFPLFVTGTVAVQVEEPVVQVIAWELHWVPHVAPACATKAPLSHV